MSSGPTSASRVPTPRTLLAIIAGLVAVVIGLSAVVVQTAIDRAAIDAERSQSDYTIKQLTKRIYWLEQQLGQ